MASHLQSGEASAPAEVQREPHHDLWGRVDRRVSLNVPAQVCTCLLEELSVATLVRVGYLRDLPDWFARFMLLRLLGSASLLVPA
jgi:hypothetical protein